MTEEVAPPASVPTTSVSRNAGITAVVAGLFYFLRILAVAKWDWDTAAEVAATVGFGDAAAILLGTVFAEPLFTGALIVTLTPLVIITLIWPTKDDRTTTAVFSIFLAGIAALAVSLTVSFGEWWITIGALLATAALAAVRMLWKRGRIHRATMKLLRSLGVVGIVGALAMAAGVSTPWVALERIDTVSGPIHGYVLETPSGFLKVLTDDPREVITLISSDVSAREVTDR